MEVKEEAQQNILQVTDKRRKVELAAKRDPASELINKVYHFVLEQPEFYHVLQLSRGERKMLASHIAKIMTTFPHFNKVGTQRD